MRDLLIEIEEELRDRIIRFTRVITEALMLEKKKMTRLIRNKGSGWDKTNTAFAPARESKTRRHSFRRCERSLRWPSEFSFPPPISWKLRSCSLLLFWDLGGGSLNQRDDQGGIFLVVSGSMASLWCQWLVCLLPWVVRVYKRANLVSLTRKARRKTWKLPLTAIRWFHKGTGWNR